MPPNEDRYKEYLWLVFNRMDAQHIQEVNIMGKGDRKSRKGKIWRGTNGKTHPKNKNKTKK